jgi:V/A-type H+-transporting ATPase subunit E
MAEQRETTTGVQQLVDQLRQDGVDEGTKEAERIISEARREAAVILEQAERDAVALREEAGRACSRTQAAAEQALALAVRDAQLELRTEIEDRFVTQLGRLVAGRLEDAGFVEKLILAAAGRSALDDESLEVLVAAGSDDEGGAPRSGEVDALIRGLTDEMVRDGVAVSVSDELGSGILIRVAERGLEVQLDDATLTALLARNLLPRFRSLLDSAGVDQDPSGSRE